MKICVLTGKLGGYSAMRPMLSLMEKDEDIEFILLVTDQHLYTKFGRSVSVIIEDGFTPLPIDIQQEDETAYSRSKAEAQVLVHFAKALDNIRPDLLILFGDRGESLSAAHAALNAGIPIAHLQGGDTTGGVDDRIRDAITCMSSLHFVSCHSSACEIEDIRGIDNICVVGDFHIDPLMEWTSPPIIDIAENLHLDYKRPWVLITQHSDTLSPSTSYQEMNCTLNAVREELPDFEIVVTYPCSDVGYKGIMDAIEELSTPLKLKVFKALRPESYIGVMNASHLIIGNSSAGIIEAPYLETMSIDIGDRQRGRMRPSSVTHADHDKSSIRDAIRHSLYKPCEFEKLYGDGTAGIQTIKEIKKWWEQRNLQQSTSQTVSIEGRM